MARKLDWQNTPSSLSIEILEELDMFNLMLLFGALLWATSVSAQMQPYPGPMGNPSLSYLTTGTYPGLPAPPTTYAQVGYPFVVDQEHQLYQSCMYKIYDASRAIYKFPFFMYSGKRLVLTNEDGGITIYGNNGSTSVNGLSCEHNRSTDTASGMVALLNRLIPFSERSYTDEQMLSVRNALTECREVGGSVSSTANEIWGRLNLSPSNGPTEGGTPVRPSRPTR